MITANETGVDAGRYLYAPFETSTGGVQRTDLWTGVTKTIVQSGTQASWPVTSRAGPRGAPT